MATRPSLDAILELLADRRRRRLLARFVARPAQATTIDDLVDHLAGGEPGDGRPAPDCIELELLHVHLPKLADAGIVEYDERSRQVRYRGSDRVETLLERVRDEAGD